jgi:hypothetical protein
MAQEEHFEKFNLIIMYATNASKLQCRIQNYHNYGHETSSENVFTRFCKQKMDKLIFVKISLSARYSLGTSIF